MPIRRAVLWPLVLVPPTLLLLFALTYSVNGPEWDHLSSTEIFSRWHRPGGLTADFLFSQHNEHRKAAPRVATLGIGLMTRWNTRVEAGAHWVLMCLTAIGLFAAFRREIGGDRATALLRFVPIALLLVSPRSYEALLGDGFPHYLSILAMTGALHLLVVRRPSAPLVGAAIACGLAASFSIANGLLVWPIGAVVLVCRGRADAAPRAVALPLAAWILAGAATIAFYFRGYVDPGNHPPPGFVFEHPLQALAYLLALLGSSLAPWQVGAVLVGSAIIVGGAWCLLRAVSDSVSRAMPPLGAWLFLTVLLSALMVSLNRAGFGLVQAMESRYTALSVLAPIGVYWCLAVRGERWRLSPAVSRAAAAVLIAGYAFASIDAWLIAPSWHSRKAWQAYLAYTSKYQPPAMLERLYPSVEAARTYTGEMERLQLSVFAGPHIQPETLSPGLRRPDYRVDVLNNRRPYAEQPIAVTAGDAIEVSGWAFNETRSGPARAIFLNIDGTRDLPGHTGMYRETLGGALRGRGRRWGGFTASFDAGLLPPGEHTLAVKIVSDDGRRFFLSGPIGRVVRQ